jgi:peptide subunit release factor 1 (eRF1)/intein/homing endonuclease
MPNVDTSKKFDSVEKYRIRKLLSELADKTGRGTELVSLYLPPKKAIHEAIAALREESGTASNIKSDVTRNHVQDALTKTMARLRLYKQTPENGLVIFCGAIPGPGGPGNETIDLFEVIPQKQVTTYLYRCLAPDTMILLDDDSQASIKSLAGKQGQNVWTYDIEQKKLSRAPVERHIETLSGSRKVYRITVESGRSITATGDHPFFTPKGWITLGELKPGDLTCINPSFKESNVSQTIIDDYVLVDEDRIRKMDVAPANLDSTIRRLKQRGLLPLRMSNPKLYLLSRLLGQLFSDDSLSHDQELRNGRPYSHFTVDFCLGGDADYEDLKVDLSKLGVEAKKPYDRRDPIRKDGRTQTTNALHVKVRDAALYTLLRAIGAPTGSEARNCPPIPSWLFDAPSAVQREFLASYMGGDGEAPRIVKSNHCDANRLTFNGIEGKRELGMEFATGIRRLFSNFGVIVNEITHPPGYLRKDGSETVGVELRFEPSHSNVLNLCRSIGFRYCKRKSDQANRVGEYLMIRRFLSEGLREKMNRAHEMSANSSTLIEIPSTLGLLMSSGKQLPTGGVNLPLVRSTSLPEYDDWLELARASLGGGLLWESVVSKEEVKMENVMDITVGNDSHNFFANGFLVHNCDDHFHLEPLREMLREQNVIGILSMDSTDGGLGIVSGDSWEVVDTMTSGVSGKTRKGGQCVSEDTLVQLDDGRLIRISEITSGSKILSYEFKNYSSGTFECADTYSIIPKDYYEISTTRPQMTIKATGEHRFFTLGRRGISTIQAHELKPGDKLLVSKKLSEPSNPVLDTRFPGFFRHRVDSAGRKILINLRKERRLSQASLAKEIGLIQTEISHLERGERDLVWENLQRIITFLTRDRKQFNQEHVATSRILPEYFTPDLLQLMGYIAGNGFASKKSISLYEHRKVVAKLYSNLGRTALGLDSVPIHRVDKIRQKESRSKKSCYETRIYSKIFVDSIGQYYSGLISLRSREIPEQIHRLDNPHLAHFLRGLFDAEGQVSKTRIGIVMRSGLLIRQLQLLLLRFGIVTSYRQYENKFGTAMHALYITDLSSIAIFSSEIGFSSADKRTALQSAANRKQTQSYLREPILASNLNGTAKELGIRGRQFEGVTNFFDDQRGTSRAVFERMVDAFQSELLESSDPRGAKTRLSQLQETVTNLRTIAECDLVLSIVSRVERKTNMLRQRFVDIEIPITRSFIGNGFVLHNSARRYERLREMELSDYFRRLADHAKKAFLEQYQIKGLIVSGPGPTKDEFVRDKYLDYRLQNMIVGILDSGYAGREGVRETIEKAGKLLENVRVMDEKKLVQRFFRELNSDTGLAIYGVTDILAGLKKAAVDTIIINDDVDTVYLKATCNKCGNVTERFVPRSQIVGERQKLLACAKCGSNEVEITQRDIVDYLADAAIDSGANVEVISSKTEDGAMMKNFGGISAILRYRP